ncbi:helix-turn-helix domain-containing protein [Halorubrum vacuolatum]|uniref:HTH DNA binding domain-containing protein n=1 Tax=Halorubrum vacuolatum TaxID=63740 RepID=A0A238WKN7_HALVU|nr:helix-turn-helix domain-containing protein [Halorubrum vacuolatum]SNR47120.1 HTH DNA binding domain-containing protein [Halorubrum vacuolatum]
MSSNDTGPATGGPTAGGMVDRCREAARSTADPGADECTEPGESFDERGVQAVLEVERGGACPLDDFEGDVIDVDVRYQMGRCLGEVEVRECRDACSSTRQFSEPICEHCPGIVFSRYGCIPRFLRTGDGSFVVETRLDTVETLSALVNEIRGRCASVTVRSIISTEGPDGTESCSVDLSALTPKQREAVSLAQDHGYYDPSSEVALSELAAELDISTSALSQRLQRAESNVLGQLDCGCRCLDG